MGGHPYLARRDDEGFTLIELMVVLLIIAILIAIAIPSFLGARRTANDRAVQANVRNAFTATRIYYNDKLAYTSSPSDLQVIEPSLSWTNTPLDGTSPDRSILVWVSADTQTVVVAGRTKQGRCFYLRDAMGSAGTGTYYDLQVPSGASCPDPSTLTITNGAWSTS